MRPQAPRKQQARRAVTIEARALAMQLIEIAKHAEVSRAELNWARACMGKR
jgi:hypothetical protein